MIQLFANEIAVQWTGSNWPEVVAFGLPGEIRMVAGEARVATSSVGARIGDYLVKNGECGFVTVRRDYTPADEPAPADEPGPFDDAEQVPLAPCTLNAAAEEAFRRAYPAVGAMSGYQLERALRGEFTASFIEAIRAAELLRDAAALLHASDGHVANTIAKRIDDYLKERP